MAGSPPELGMIENMIIMNFRNSDKIETVKDCGNNSVISSCLSEGQDVLYSETILDPSGYVAGIQAVGLSGSRSIQIVAL